MAKAIARQLKQARAKVSEPELGNERIQGNELRMRELREAGEKEGEMGRKRYRIRIQEKSGSGSQERKKSLCNSVFRWKSWLL